MMMESSNNDNHNHNLYRKLCLASSTLFLLGSSLEAIMTVLWIAGSSSQRVIAACMEIVSWSLIGASAVPQMYIDFTTTITRPRSNGRYTSRHAWLNWLESVFFVGGATLLGLAFKRLWDNDTLYWEDEADDREDYFFQEKDYLIEGYDSFLYGGLLFSVAAAIAVFGSGGCCCCGATNESCAAQTANWLFLSASIACSVASLPEFSCGNCFIGFFLLVGVRISLCISGILWVISDCSSSNNGERMDDDPQHDDREVPTE